MRSLYTRWLAAAAGLWLGALSAATPVAAQDGEGAAKPHHEKGKHHGKEGEPEAGGPEWLLTMHGDAGGNTVLGLSADGKPLGPAVAEVPASEGGPLRDLRGLARLKDGGVLVVNAFKDRTFVARYGPADGANPRPLVGIPIRGGAADSAVMHPYQIAIAADGTIFLANQDSNTVTRHAPLDAAEPGRPLPPPAALAGVAGLAPGTFIASERQVKEGLREVRGVLIAPDGSLLVADKKRSSVFRFDARSGARLGTVLGPEHGAKAPIQLAMDPDGALLVGDNEREVIWHVPLAGGEVRPIIDCAGEGVKAPSVIAVDGTSILVGSRTARRIDRFDLGTGKKIGVFAENLPDAPEFLLRVTP